jgi:DNA-binding NarL/FixJ family response regulator
MTSQPSQDSRIIRVAIVDDAEGIRTNLAALIRVAPALRLIGEYANAEIALKEIPQHLPDVVLMDINLPRMNGVECVRQLKAQLPQVQFLMLTVYEDSDSLFDSLRAGASGYLLKRTATKHLIESIQDIHAGGSPMSPQMARRVVMLFNQPAPHASELIQLTPTEKEFLRQLAKGFTYKEIAARMNIAMDTVRTYVRKVYEKLHVHSRTEAVVKYLHHRSPE